MQTDPELSESILSVLVEGPAFVCIHDPAKPSANFVSPAFLEYAGLPADAVHAPDLVAQLVHPDDAAVVREAWERAAGGGRAEYEFRMRLADGGYRRLSAVARALPGASGQGCRFVVTAQDVEDRKRADARLHVLVSAGEIFHQSLEPGETLANIARLAVSDFADLCIIDLLEEDGAGLYVTAAALREGNCERDIRSEVTELLHDSQFGVHPAIRVVQTGEPFFVPHLDDDIIALQAVSRRHAEFMRRMGYASKIIVPVGTPHETFGCLTFVLTGGTRYFDRDDLGLAKELGRRAGAAIANSRQYMRERHVATTLQHAFIPSTFPARPGIRFDGIYIPGKGDAEIGGDWFDVFETRGGSIVVAIGDVTGNGVEAAQTMVQLRQSVRVASVRNADPAEILRLANDALFAERQDRFASAWIGVIPPAGNAIVYASAGHPPPFVRRADGYVEQLVQSGQLLGVAWECDFRTFERRLEPGMFLVLYTDGLTENWRDVAAAERQIAAVLRGQEILTHPRPAGFLQERVVQNELRDDLAVVTIACL